MDIKSALQTILKREDLGHEDMVEVMRSIMTGQATPAQIGGFLIGLRMKGETVTEITAAAEVMRELATPVQVDAPHLVDTCGTGGDGISTFNISTASAFVVAAAGGRVAKHGNRSVSSRSGSADVLEAAGVKLDINAAQVAQCIEQIGVGFMFAPLHHSAMKHAIGPRQEMGVRTVFNLLGPLTNPAGAPHQVMGVFSRDWVEPIAEVLRNLGSRHVLVVHAEDGMDEISLNAPTFVAELKQGEIRTYSITPEQFGFNRAGLETIAVQDVAHSLETLCGVLQGKPGPARDIVLLNAGAALYAADVAESMESGIAKAAQAIDSGAASDTLERLIQLSQSLA